MLAQFGHRLACQALLYLFTLAAADEEAAALSLLQHGRNLLEEQSQWHHAAELREGGHTQYQHSASSSVGHTDGKTSANSSRGSSSALVMMHVPFNFGNTVASVAASRTSGALLWGPADPALAVKSDATGCDMFYTPQKYWPEDLAQQYFGDATVFGMPRDPYERLAAMFRGGNEDYGGFPPGFHDTCDLNAAVKAAVTEYLSSNDTFKGDCTWVPQAEYFDGPYGISLPIDNRYFPTSMNDALLAHGYDSLYIHTEDVLHVSGCDNVWAGDLDAEARHLVQTLYKRDFELICQFFGHCDVNETVCLREIPQMCPEKAFHWDAAQNSYVPL